MGEGSLMVGKCSFGGFHVSVPPRRVKSISVAYSDSPSISNHDWPLATISFIFFVGVLL